MHKNALEWSTRVIARGGEGAKVVAMEGGGRVSAYVAYSLCCIDWKSLVSHDDKTIIWSYKEFPMFSPLTYNFDTMLGRDPFVRLWQFLAPTQNSLYKPFFIVSMRL